MLKLTEREKKVFYGLIRWPELTDKELSEKLGIGRSTVTTIRNRLEGHDLYKTINVPDFERIGCEVFTALYGEYHPKASYSKIREDIEKEFGSMFFMMSMGVHKLSLGASKTFTEVKKHIEEYHLRHHEIGVSYEKKHTYVLFPLKLSRIFRFFDYSPLLKEHFKLDIEEEGEKGDERKITLTRNEKEVYHALIRHPELTDGKIASKTGMSRQTVSAIKKKIMEHGLIKRIRVPDVGKLGFELLAFTHMHMNPKMPIEKRSEGIELMMESPANILKVSGNLESIMLSVFKDYTEYLNTYDKLFSYYKENDFLLEEPTVKIFSTREADLEMHHRYHPLVESVFMSTE
ncbi:MAG: hypothetical protein JW778_03325 [Candidatus Altiarchaeota archaeon]|nr:hypothetical protein [Candidatus Altiarchaeota archaeon]